MLGEIKIQLYNSFTMHAKTKEILQDHTIQEIDLFYYNFYNKMLIFNYIKVGDIYQVKTYIENEKDVNFLNYDGDTLLITAIRHRRFEIVECLLNAGANVNFKTRNSETALIVAVNSKNLSLVELLLANGADVNLTGYSDNTPLIRAVICNVPAIIETLIHCGANLNLQSNLGNTALIIACCDNLGYEIIKLLTEKGAKINIKNMHGRTALFHSCLNNYDIPVIELLLKNGADVNASDNNGKTGLHMTENVEIAKLLLSYGADPFIRNISSKSNDYIQLIEEAAWKKLKERDLNTALRYARNSQTETKTEIKLNKDVWYLILLNRRLNLLSQNNNKRIYLLKLFAIDVGVDRQYIEKTNKAELCGLISRQIGKAFGKGVIQVVNDAKYLKSIECQIKNLAFMYNINTNQCVENILTLLSKTLKQY